MAQPNVLSPPLPDLGINSNSIYFGVAIQVLGDQVAPLMRQLVIEREQGRADGAFSKYLDARIEALLDLREQLDPADKELILQILDPSNLLFRTQIRRG